MLEKLIKFLKSKINIAGDFLTFGKTGQINIIENGLAIQSFNKKNLELFYRLRYVFFKKVNNY